jgi:hypothetical protein
MKACRRVSAVGPLYGAVAAAVGVGPTTITVDGAGTVAVATTVTVAVMVLEDAMGDKGNEDDEEGVC